MKLQLSKVKNELTDVRTFIFEPPQPLTWQPGQYMHYVLEHPEADDRGVERWFTIAAAPYEKHIQITTRLASDHGSSFKRALIKLQPGDEIEADGPKGKFVLDDPVKQHIFIAGGIGITPFRAMLLQLDHDKQPINVDLLYANRNDNFVFDKELMNLADHHPQFKIHKFVDPARIETKDIKAVAAKLDDPEYYVSGPEPMVEAFEKTLKSMGIAEAKIHLDFFPGY